MIVIHVRHEEKTWDAELLTDVPCSQCARLDACLTVHHDDGSVRYRNRFLHLAHEIKITRSVQYIDLEISVLTLILNRNGGRGNRKLSLDFFLVVIRNCVALRDASHPGGGAGDIGQSLCYGRLTCAAMSQKNNVTYVSGVIYLHKSFPPVHTKYSLVSILLKIKA